MICVTELSKSYGERVLFNDLSFSINRGDRIGVVGRNGSGKSTLFAMLLGQSDHDTGSIMIPRNYRIGHLQQHITFSRPTVIQEACLGLREEEKDDHWKVEKVLFGLGFSKEDMQKPPSLFSGGFQIRLNLAKVLVASPDLLLLDEPNNYLDIVATRWLRQFLASWKTEIMLITHDRGFMDSITTHTMIIHRKKVKKVEGNTAKLYAQIAQEEEIYEKTRVHDEREQKKTELFIQRFRAKARLGGLVQSRVKCLEKQEKRAKLEKMEGLEFSFNAAPFPAAQMMATYNVAFSYDGKEPYLVDSFSLTVGKNERIGVIGKNGKGKTTLLRVLAGELTPLAGNIKRHAALRSGYFGQSNVARLNPEKTVYEEVMEDDPACLPQTARSICGAMMFGGDNALKKVAVLSGGEKSRVLLGKLLVKPATLLLLDEPTNHLDMESCDALLEAINAYEGSVVMVTHNEMFLHALATRLVIFDKGRITLFEGTYQEFLDEVGWQDEEALLPEKPAKSREAVDKKAQKRVKAELLQERFRALSPLETQIEQLERSISSNEQELHKTTEHLVQASTEGDAAGIARLSKRHHELRPHIESLYLQLDKVLSEHKAASEQFQKRLSALQE